MERFGERIKSEEELEQEAAAKKAAKVAEAQESLLRTADEVKGEQIPAEAPKTQFEIRTEEGVAEKTAKMEEVKRSAPETSEDAPGKVDRPSFYSKDELFKRGYVEQEDGSISHPDYKPPPSIPDTLESLKLREAELEREVKSDKKVLDTVDSKFDKFLLTKFVHRFSKEGIERKEVEIRDSLERLEKQLAYARERREDFERRLEAKGKDNKDTEPRK